MRTEQKTNVKNSVGRLLFVFLAILSQVIWIILQAIKLNEYSTVISLITSILALTLVLSLYGRHTTSTMKIPWIMLILAFPLLGVILYITMGNSLLVNGRRRQFHKIDAGLFPFLMQDDTVMEELAKTDRASFNLSGYLWRYGHFPVYQNTDVTFFKTAEEGLEAQKIALKNAKKFIFMEYHAIEDAKSFGEIRKILAERVKAGVEVRVFYDDVGSIGFINRDFIKRMEAEGIQCRVFNPVIPVLNMFMNNRDHRKITVVDGYIGFTGGYNMADEYFNITHPYGHWKDTGVRMMGDAVKSLTILFLEMWNAIRETDQDIQKYLPRITYQAAEEGFVQPYGDSPLDEERIGENVYLNIIKNAKEYVFFMTPYLILSDEMNSELCLAAKRGVDVRIITPGIPDKKVVFQMTRSYYARLAQAGVRIYEYTPGFCHAKQCVADGETATNGTINLDFRSLYLHFENGVYLYKCPAIEDIKQDFEETFSLSTEVTEKYSRGRTTGIRIRDCILRLFAPLV